MSKTVERVVAEMDLDNSKFEEHAKQSMSTLDKLKKELDVEKSADSLKNLSKAADNVSFDGMKKGLDEVSVHFTKLEAAAKRVIENITDDLYQLGKNMVSALTIDLPKAGWNQYADETRAVTTIMNATGLSIDEVTNQLDKLTWFTDETSYSFTDMINNIGKFTGMGVDLDKAVSAMMGISNWASAAGGGINEAQRAMYNMSQAFGSGAVKVLDWSSIEGANMATKEFREQVIETAKALGTLDAEGKTAKGTLVTFQTFRDSLSEGWFTSDVLLSVLNDYSKFMDLVYERVQATGESCSEAMEYVSKNLGDQFDAVSEKAGRASQEARTFSDVLETIQEGVGSQWKNIFKSLFGDAEEQKVTWTDLSNSLYEVFATPIADFAETLEEAMNPKTVDAKGWAKIRKDLVQTLDLTSEHMDDFERVLKNVAKESGIDIDEMIEKNGDFASSLKEGWLTSDLIQEAYDKIINGSAGLEGSTEKLEEYQDIVSRVWEGEFGNGEQRWSLLEQMGYDPAEIQRLVDLGYGVELTLDDIGESTSELITLYGSDLAEALKNGGDSVESLQEQLKYVAGKDLRNGFFQNLFSVDEENPGAIISYITAIREAFEEVFGTIDSGGIHGVLERLYTWSVKLLDEKRIEKFKSSAKKVFDVVKDIFEVFKVAFTFLKGDFMVLKAVWNNTLGPLLSGLFNIVKAVADGIGNLASKFNDSKGKMQPFEDAVAWLNENLAPVKDVIVAVTDGIASFITQLFEGKSVVEAFRDMVKDVIDKLFGEAKAEELKEKFDEILDKLLNLKDSVVETFNHIIEKVKEAFNIFKNTELGQAISDFIGRVAGAISDTWESIKEWIKEKFHLEDSDFDFFGSFQTAIDNFNTWLDEIDLETGLQNVSDAVMNFKDNIKGAFESVKTWFEENETIQTVVSTIKEKFGEVKDAVVDAMGGTEDDGVEKEPFLTRVLNGLKAALQWFIDNLPSVDEVIGLIGTILGSAAFVNLISMIKNVKDMFSGGAGFINNINKVLSGLSLALKGFAFEKFALGALAFAGAIALVAAALFGLSLVDSNKLMTAAAAIALVAASIGLLTAGIGKLMEAMGLKKNSEAQANLNNAKAGVEGAKAGLINSLSTIGSSISGFISNMGQALTKKMMITSYAKMILSMAVALGVLAAAVYVFAQIPLEQLIQGVGAVVVLIGVLAGAMKMMTAGTTSDFSITKAGLSSNRKGAGAAGTGVGLLGVAFAILVLVEVIREICKYNIEELLTGLGTIGLLLLEMTAFTRFGGNLKVSTGITLILFAGLMKVFVGMISDLTKFSFGQIAAALTATAGIVVEMVFFTRYAESMKGKSVGSLILLAVSMLLFVESVKRLAVIKFGPLVAAVGALGAVMLEVVLFSKYIQKVQFNKGTTGTLLGIGVMMLLFVESVRRLAEIEFGPLVAAVVSLGAVMLEVILFSKQIQKISFNKGTAATLVGIGIMIALFTASLVILAQQDWLNILVSMVALIAVMETVVLFSKQIQKIKFDKDTAVVLVAMGLAVGVFAAALFVLGSVPWQSLLAGAGSLIALLLGVTGVAYLLSAVSGSLKDIGILLIGAAAVIAAIAGSIWLVSKALDDVDMERLRTLLSDLVVTLVQNLVDSIVGSADAIIGGLIDMLQTIVDNADRLVNLAIDLVIKVLHLLSERMPELANALSEFAQAVMSSFSEAFAGVDLSPLADVIQNMIIAVGAIVLIGKFGGFGAALKGIGIFALVVVAITAVFTGLSYLLGLLADGTDFGQKLASGIELLIQIADGIGSFIGTLIGSLLGSAAEAFTERLPSIGTNLSLFMENVQPFIDGVSKIDGSFLEAIGILSLAMLEITGANFVDSLMNGLSWLVGGGDSTSFMSKFVVLGESLGGFANAIAGVDFSTVESAAACAGVISALVNVMPREGGLLQKLIGEKNIEEFATGIGSLGTGVADFCTSLSGVTVDATMISSVATAIQSLVNVAPNEGGLLQKLIGEKNLQEFANSLGPLGMGVASFCFWLQGVSIDTDTVSAAATAIQELVNVAPNEGGWLQAIIGEENLPKFAQSLGPLGQGVRNFCFWLQGITVDTDTVSAAATAIQSIVNIAPNEGGFWQEIAGSKDLPKFAGTLGKLGEGVKNFCSHLTDITIDDGTVTSATTAISTIVAIAPSENGLWQQIAGAKDLNSFASVLDDLGNGVKNFCTPLSNISIDSGTVTAAIDAIRAIVEVVPNSHGIWQYIVGEQNFSGFGDSLKDLGDGVAAYMDATKDTTKTQAQRGKIAAEGIIEILKLEWPKSGGLFNWLAEGIVSGSTDFDTLKQTLIDIGTMASSMKTSFADVSSADIDDAYDACSSIVSILNLEWPATDKGFLAKIGDAIGITEGDTEFGTLGGQLEALAKAVVSFSNEAAKIDPLAATKAYWCGWVISNLVSSLPEDISNLTNLDTYSGSISTMGTSIGEFATSVENVNYVTLALAILSIKNLIETLSSMSEVDFDKAGSFSSAIGKLATTGVTKFLNTFSSAKAKTDRAIATFITNVNTTLNTASSRFNSSGSAGLSSYLSAFSSAYATAKIILTVGSMLSIIANTLSITAPFEAAGQADANAFSFAFARDTTAETRAKGMALSAARAINGQYQNFIIAGQNCIVGVINGFAAYEDVLYNRAQTMGANSVRSFNRGAGVHSPSKLFMESAMYCIKGAVMGYEKYGYQLEEAARATGTSSVEVMRDAMQGLNFTDLDNSPVIRPVLDLSNIQNGVGTLNNLLDARGNVSINAMGAIQLASGIDRNVSEADLNSVYNDAGVIQSIAELGARVDALNESILNMKLVLNGKDLVGGIVYDMDDALGSLSAKKNAGVL